MTQIMDDNRQPQMRTPVLGFRIWGVVVTPRLTTVGKGRIPLTAEHQQWADRQREKQLGDTGLLTPISHNRMYAKGGPDLTWAKPGPVHFECRCGALELVPRHDLPTMKSSCGLYANLAPPGVIPFADDGWAMGAVIAWGRVILHGTEGFRAEWMQIVALSGGKGRGAKIAAERLGVPCVPLDQLETVGREFGHQIGWRYTWKS